MDASDLAATMDGMTNVFHVARRTDPHAPSHAPGAILGNVALAPNTYPGVFEAVARRFPGGVSNHGAQYLGQWPQGRGPSFVAEAVFEAVRLAEAPDKPSRMTSWFASECLEDALAFVAMYRQDCFVDIWRAEAEVVHRGNMALLQALDLPVVAALERASAYWRGDRGPAALVWEVLVAPGMRLLEVVETTGNAAVPLTPPGTVL